MAEEAKKEHIENQDRDQGGDNLEEKKDPRNEDGDLVIKLGNPDLDNEDNNDDVGEGGDDNDDSNNDSGDNNGEGNNDEGVDDNNEDGNGDEDSEDAGDSDNNDSGDDNNDNGDSGDNDGDDNEEGQGDQSPEIPENVQKLVDFMNETGGSMQDFVNLNREYTNDDILIREWLKSTNPDFNKDDIDFEIEERFSYDESDDEERDIKKKKLAKKRAVREAKAYFDGLKDKYYAEVKLTKSVPESAKEAVEFHKNFLEQEEKSKRARTERGEHFTKMSNDLFNEKFKGFEFSVGDESFQFEVKDANSLNEAQNNIFKVFNKYTDQKTGMLKDAAGYHKAIFAARNADAIAKHFYELGKAHKVKADAKDSKNIDMNNRDEGDPSGRGEKQWKVRDVSDDDNNTFSSGKLKISASK